MSETALQPTLRTASASDIPALVALNADVVDVTSPMDAARCAALLAACSECLVADQKGAVLGFALIFQTGDAYDGENFAWFSARLDRFAYVDRIVLAPQARGLKLGSALYARVAADAQAAGCTDLAAEMNLVPPNAPSLAFHAAQGFREIGTREMSGGKVLSMQVKDLTA